MDTTPDGLMAFVSIRAAWMSVFKAGLLVVNLDSTAVTTSFLGNTVYITLEEVMLIHILLCHPTK